MFIDPVAIRSLINVNMNKTKVVDIKYPTFGGKPMEDFSKFENFTFAFEIFVFIEVRGSKVRSS